MKIKCKYCRKNRVAETIICGYAGSQPLKDGKIHYICRNCNRELTLDEVEIIEEENK